jgi:2-oxoglutarate dehydrogenase E2 component (dihydrolipoamide succinyltransferase)
MPQLGESIVEGTIVRWIKKVGDTVDRDEPLFEISTDKVDAEIPSPVGGVLAEIRAPMGETVPVNSVVAVIGADGETVVPAPAEGDAMERGNAVSTPGLPGPAPRVVPGATTARQGSPLVRRLAAEHDVDLAAIVGTGGGGRVTKADVLSHIAGRGGSSSDPLARSEAAPTDDPGRRAEQMTEMRRQIAEHMVRSRRTSAHVHTVFEVDFSGIATLRTAPSASGRAPGYLSYIAKAVVEALVAMPVVNASVDGDSVVYHESVNLGIAVALDWGLIVPVIKRAERLGVGEIDAAIIDLATRARAKRLAPDDVDGGTFTITNPGSFGSVFGMPIINQPQSAILCVGAIEKRPVVVDDAVVARLRAFLTLGFDHRLIDGAVADQFLARVKDALESASQEVRGNRSEAGGD